MDTSDDVGDIREVAEVTHAPRPLRAHRVQLERQAPALPVAEFVGPGQPGGSDGEDTPRAPGDSRGLRMQRVPAERQLGREREGRAADEFAVDFPRVDPHVELVRTDALTGLGHYPHLHGFAMWHVHREVAFVPLHGHDRRRKHRTPRRLVERGERTSHLLGGSRRYPQRGQDGLQGRLVDIATDVVEAVVRGGDAVPLGEGAQVVEVAHAVIVPGVHDSCR